MSVHVDFKASIFKNERTLSERIEKFISKSFFVDVNLFGRLYSDRNKCENVLYLNCGQTRVPWREAVDRLQNCGVLLPTPVGQSIGPTWSTHWFQIELQQANAYVEYSKKDHQLCLLWDSGCEALVWDAAGNPLMSFAAEKDDKTEFCITDDVSHSHLCIEVACNSLFGAGKDGLINPPDLNKVFVVKTAHFALRNNAVFDLLIDFEILFDLVSNLPTGNVLRYTALYFANTLITDICASNFDGNVLKHAHLKCSQFFESNKNPAQTSLILHAVANCHIDTAWLWSYGETRRKTIRSWSTALRLMDAYSDLVFACSQMQQLDWLKSDCPKLFEKLKIRASEGKFAIVGGAWVEFDGNLPSGESLVRQMLYGQMFCNREFGTFCDIFWLPDTFGYSAQLPQLMSKCGMTNFVTQKLSWNLVNKFPHNTFVWKGLDGSEVLTHFPPCDTYCSEIKVADLVNSNQNFKDKGRSSNMLMLYGHGDGGGGPTDLMLERMKRLVGISQQSDSLSTLVLSTPKQFFNAVEAERNNLCVWKGELYLELHNGTYTTQSQVKFENRKMEMLLKIVEFLSTFKHIVYGEEVRNWECEWKKVLLNQFHDVLPGSSIAEVYKDAMELYKAVQISIDEYLKAGDNHSFCNVLPWQRVIFVSGLNEHVSLPPFSIIPVNLISNFKFQKVGTLKFKKMESVFFLANDFLEVTVDKFGRVITLAAVDSEKSTKVEFVSANRPCNQFCLYDDIPLFWDAWDVMDYHLDTRKPVIISEDQVLISLVENINEVGISFSYPLSDHSRLTQCILLNRISPYLQFECAVDWHERHKMLKVEFPFLKIHNPSVNYEIQFGHVMRSNHRNTSWDSAQFEVCAHKWADVFEYNGGVALINNAKYGHSCIDNILTLSLLRSPKAPDDTCDMGNHEFKYAIMPHIGPFQSPSNCPINVIQAAYEFNTPALLEIRDAKSTEPLSLFQIDNQQVVIDTVKIAESCDQHRRCVLRMYESFGGGCVAKVSSFCPIKDVCECDLLERPSKDSRHVIFDGHSITVMFSAFEIISLLLTFD